MTIKNYEAVANKITKWIEDQVIAAGQQTAVLGLSGGVDSALVALLCKRSTKIATVGVIMPCHSSQSAATRAEELAKKIDLKVVTVDLSKSHELIAGAAADSIVAAGLKIKRDHTTEGALRSCLRAPTLDYVAKCVNGLVVGTGNRDEDEVTRYFQKRGDGAVDISPISKLHKSEVYALANYLGCTEAILTAVPTADLWGPNSNQTDEGQLGVTYPEIEWAIGLNDERGAFFNEYSAGRAVSVDVALNLTERQKYVLRTLMAMEKSSRHKSRMPPVLHLRDETDDEGNELFEPTHLKQYDSLFGFSDED